MQEFNNPNQMPPAPGSSPMPPQQPSMTPQSSVPPMSPPLPPTPASPPPLAPEAPLPSMDNQFSAPQPPAPPSYSRPLPNYEDSMPPEEPKKRRSAVGVIIAVLAVLVILALAFVFYYYATQNYKIVPVGQTDNLNSTTSPSTPVSQVPAGPVTTVFAFTAPTTLPAATVSGTCFANSIAQPYRQDAWRCIVGNAIYDPCFATSDPNSVYCQNNPATGTGVTMHLTKTLPQPAVITTTNPTWAWFLKLEDGTICSPFTGTRPMVSGQMATYGCRAADKTHQIYIVGDLMVNGSSWTGTEIVSEQKAGTWVPAAPTTVNIDTVWQ